MGRRLSRCPRLGRRDLSVKCWWLGALVAMSVASPAGLSAEVAFSGAKGYGAGATGWRNGRILKVVNTNDSGRGSLRDCLERQSGPRLCLVATGGTINLDRAIFVRSDVYLAGQTAPGDGIQLRLSGRDDGKSPLIIKNSSNVVIRFIKSRPGPGALATPSVSALLIENSHDVMLDHLSLMFATDQVFSVHVEGGATRNITLQKSIVAWGLQNANHPKGKHSKGALICSATAGGVKAGNRCGRVTLLGNLFAHNNDRNPDVKSTGEPIEIVSNVFYNAKSQFGEFYDHYGNAKVNYIGNVALAGPSTRRIKPPYSVQIFDFNPQTSVSVYLSGNTNDHHRPYATGAETLVLDPEHQGQVLTEPIMPTAGTLAESHALLASLAPEVGAALPDGRLRDPLDARVIADAVNRTGSIIDHPSDVGGYPELDAGRTPEDTDQDGLPDVWEDALPGLQAATFDAWDDRDGDGWSNIEEYLSVLAGDMPDPRP